MVECVTCGGRYEPMLPDGTQYFHACPPLAVHELKARLDDGTLALSKADTRRLQAAHDADGKDPFDEGEESRVDEVLRSLVVERPNKRDENIRVGPAARDGRSRIKAEGAGVVDVEPE